MGKPGSINIVSVLLVAVLTALGYLGWKIIPVYWQANQVDNALSSAQFEASKIHLIQADPREEKLLDRLHEDIIALGIEERRLQVYFARDYSSIHADYWVRVKFPFDYAYDFEFKRKMSIERDDDY